MKCHNCGFESELEICPLCGGKKTVYSQTIPPQPVKQTPSSNKMSNKKIVFIVLLCLTPVIIFSIFSIIMMTTSYFRMLDYTKKISAGSNSYNVNIDNNVYEIGEVIELEWGTLELTKIEPAPLDASFDELYNDNIYEISLELTNTSDRTYMISYEDVSVTDNDNSVIVDNAAYKNLSKGIDPGETHNIKAVAVVCQPETKLEFTYDFNCLTGDTAKYSYNFLYPIP